MGNVSFVFALCFWIANFATPAPAQMKTRFNWTAVTGAQSGIFMAQQEGLFKKTTSTSN